MTLVLLCHAFHKEAHETGALANQYPRAQTLLSKTRENQSNNLPQQDFISPHVNLKKVNHQFQDFPHQPDKNQNEDNKEDYDPE